MSIFGSPAIRYFAFFFSFSVSAPQDTSSYGPVPVALRVNSLPNLFTNVGLTIIAPGCARLFGNAPNGYFSVTFTVLSSTTSVWSIIT